MPKSPRSTKSSRTTSKTGVKRTEAARAEMLSHYPGSDKLPNNAARTVAARVIVLDSFRKGMSLQGAADAADLARRTLYEWIDDDPEFAKEVADAREGGTDRLEEEAVRRGKNGVRKAVYHQGAVVGYERVYSDRLLETTLGARRAAYRRSQSVDVTATVSGTVQHQHAHLHLTADDLKKVAAERGLPLEIFDK